ncbi:MAG: redoxin domain-containing protein [Anaerolineae bacterium]|nr:redoxin domain-containing protein [Gemmatimonadaceae bacterium]
MRFPNVVRRSLPALAGLLSSVIANAQSTPAKPAESAAPRPPLVGDVAPDFTLPGATRYGLLASPVSLSEYRGKTVVLAFFYVARTKG